MKTNRCSENISSIDIYGRPIGVAFKGRSTFRTKLGACLSLCTFVVIFVYALLLALAFTQGSRQSETSATLVFDRFKAGNFSLFNHHMNVTVFSTFFLPPRIGRVTVYQENGKKSTELGVETCSGERRDEMIDYWSSRE